MDAPFRLRASYVRIDVDERNPTGRWDRRFALLVDWTGHVQIDDIPRRTADGGRSYVEGLEILRDEIELIEFHPVGPEDSEPFLTEQARALFTDQISALSHNGGSWHGWHTADS